MKQNKLFDNPITEQPHPAGEGTQKLYRFENGYGASVVRFKFNASILGDESYGTYTSNDSEWELAVIRWTGERYELDYTTPITGDVLGHLTADEVEDVLHNIQNL